MKRLCLILLTLAFILAEVKADGWVNYQQNSSEGTDFYATFMDNNAPEGAGTLTLQLFMAARQHANVTVTLTNTGQQYTLSVDSFLVWALPTPSDAYSTLSNVVTNKTVRVQSDTPIALFMSCFSDTKGDASLVIPVSVLGNEYIVQSSEVNEYLPNFAIVATESGTTTLTINPSVSLIHASEDGSTTNAPLPAHVPFTITLDQGQVYYASTDSLKYDVSGTTISASQKVAMFNGCQASIMVKQPRNSISSHVSHQAQPILMLGTKYPLVRYLGQNTSIVKITAVYDTTLVYRNGVVIDTLNAFESKTINWTGGQNTMFVETSKQSYCYQYMFGALSEYGSPAMVFALDPQQAVKSAIFSTFTIDVYDSDSKTIVRDSDIVTFVTMIVPTNSTGSMRIDNAAVTGFSPINGNPAYSYATVQVSHGSHQLTNQSAGFIATVFGYDTIGIPSYAYCPAFNCIQQDAYFLLDGSRTSSAFIKEGADHLWHFSTTGIVKGDYDSIQWYDYSEDGGGGELGEYMYTGDNWNAAIDNPHEHRVYMKVYRHSPLTGEVIVETVYATLYCCVNTHDVNHLPACITDTVVIFGDTIRCDTLVIGKVYPYTKGWVTQYGCDSIVTYNLQVILRTDSNLHVSICQGDTFEFRGSRYTEPGTYYALDSVGHCFYNDTLNLTVNPTYRFTETDTICFNQLPYEWRDTLVVDTPGIHIVHDSLKTELGCDSLFEIILTIGAIYDITDTVYECDNHLPYEWHGMQFNESGIYYDSLVSRYGCDSIHRLMLTVSHAYRFDDSLTVCSNETFVWRDSVYYGFEPGVVSIYDSLTSSQGCDSVYAMLLTVKEANIYYTYDTICDNDSVVWRGHHIYGNKAKEVPLTAEFVDSGNHLISDSMKNAIGCDSIYHLVLRVNPTYDPVFEPAICQGDSFMFDNQMLTWMNDVPGTHDSTVHYITTLGCDSNLHLHLTVHPVYNIYHYDTVCNNMSYRWIYQDIDTTIYEQTAGTYQYRVYRQTAMGCDSFHTLQLTVLDTVIINSVAFIPDQGSYFWDNEIYGGSKCAFACDVVLPVSPTPYIFRHVYTAANGCDSILTLTIKVDETYDRTANITTCQYDDYYFNGALWNWKKDIVGDHDTTCYYKTIAGYDSIWRVHLHVNPVYLIQESDTTCRNVPYNWKGHRRTYSNLTPGLHIKYDSLYTSAGCDSVYELSLTVLDTTAIVTKTTIADNKSMTWDGMVIAGSKYRGPADVYLPDGVYEYHHTYTSKECGCDSVMHLYLTVTWTFEDSVSITTCQHQNYMFNNQAWSWKKGVAGVHDTTYTYKTKSGADSVWRLHLKVNPSYLISETKTTCQNEPYVWKSHHRTFSNLEPGIHVFYDSLKTLFTNCDSVHQLTLVVHDTIVNTEYHTICDNETFYWDGESFYGDKAMALSGIMCPARALPYTFDHVYSRAKTGCDSLERLVLYVKKTYEHVLDTTLCAKNGFEYHGIVYTKSGVYHDSLKTIDGCDSIYTLHLNLDKVAKTVQYIGICEGDSFYYRGRVVKKAGVYIDSLVTTAGGCDSVIELHFDILPTFYVRDTVRICDGGSYQFHGRTITHAGTYRDSLRTASGCDSIYELYVIVASKFHHIKYDTVCSNTIYQWRNKYLTEGGTYFDSLISKSGCDSVYELRLAMGKPSIYERYIEICQGNSFNFRGKQISQPGVYYDTLNSVHGCDSIYKLVLNFAQTYHFRDTVQICDGDAYNFHGRNISGTGTFYDSLKTVSGCDSIYEVFVRVIPKFHVIEYDTVCSNKTYNWHGKWLTEGGTYFDSISNNYGCDSVYELRLTMYRPSLHEQYVEICQGSSFHFRGKQITQPGTYYDTLNSVHGCDSIYKLVLNYAKTYYFRDTVQICDGESYNFRGKTITQAGTYRDSMKTTSGCDSIYELHLKVAPKFHDIAYDTLCSIKTYHWRGKWLTESGIYFDSLMSSQGCDSVYELRLTIYRPTIHEQYVEVCQGNSFDFRGREITQPGTYYDTLVNVHGCDSICKLVFNITRTYYFRDTTQICDGESYIFRGRTITQAGTYRDTMKTVISGCDSIYELFLKVAPKFHDIAYDTVCSNNTYHWRGKWLTESGTYFDSIVSSQGCDSVYELRLIVGKATVTNLYIEVCEGDSFDFRGRRVTEPGVYSDTLISTLGCDSIIKLVFNVTRTYHLYETIQICDGGAYQWHGMNIHQAGTYRDSLKTTSGCDSICELFVTVAPKFHNIEYDTVCTSNTYLWRGKWLTSGGTYFDSIVGSQGCDSVYELRLVMGTPTLTEYYIEVCQGDSFDFRGMRITQPGIYYDTLISRHGCDSIIKVVFNVTRKYHFYETRQICDGDAYSWHGMNIHQAGTYRDSLTTVGSGCDSIYELYVTVAPKFHNIAYDTVCSDSLYYWRGKWLTESGTYFDSIVGSQGCDSVYEFRFKMYRPTIQEQYVEICEGNSFDFRGRHITEPGIYYDTLTSVHGCDSIYKFVFNFTRTYYFRDTVMICDGQTYNFRGKSVSYAGTYRDSLKTTSGCDSIYELYVKVAPRFHNVEYDTVCTNSAYPWRGKWLTESGTYFDSLKSYYGCDSVYEMRLTLYKPVIYQKYVEVCEGTAYSFRGQTITEPGTYTDTMTTTHGYDSIFVLVINFVHKYYFSDTTYLCDGDVYNFRGRLVYYPGTYRDTMRTVVSGCDSIYEVVVKPANRFHDIANATTCSNETFFWRGKSLTETGVYYDTLKSNFGCDSVFEMRLTMFAPSVHEEYVEVCSGGSFDFRGKRITKPGVYYDTLTNVHGCDSVCRLVFNFAQTYYMRDTVEICDGDVYNFRGKAISKEGTYHDTLKTVVSGCDSIYEVFVKVNPKFHDIAHATVCSNQTYHWRGKWLSQSGTYFDTLKSHSGCDSVFEMRLVMGVPTVTEQYIEVCEGDSFDFRGKRITEQGVYFDTLVSRLGCDSIIKLVFNVARKYHFYETRQLCDGDVYNWRGRALTLAGTYRDSLQTVVSGCDSVYELFLTKAPKFHNIAYKTLCSDSVYYWRGKWLTESGTYYDSIVSTQGCDSVYELRFVMGKSTVTNLYIEVCEGESFSFRGRQITEPGVYRDTLISVLGCDSIINLVFNVTRNYHFRETRQICDGDVYRWRGKDISLAGTYRDSLTTVGSGCDSIYELYVTKVPKFHHIEYDTLCSDSLYHWRGKWITKSGTYFDSIIDPNGCDNVYELRLVMNTTSFTTIYEDVCQGDVFTFNDMRLTAPGVYYDTLTNSQGCDSIIKLVFNVRRKYHFYETHQICDGDVYNWHGKKIYLAGTYRDSLLTAGGCDSIYELTVTMNTKFHHIEYKTICRDSLYHWHGKWISKSGTYFDSIIDPNGCDSVYELRLVMGKTTITNLYIEVCEGDSFSFRGNMITEPKVYYDTLISSLGCDSIIRLVFNVTRNYHFYESRQICDGDVYRWRGRNISNAGTYRDSLTTVGSGCDSIYELFVTKVFKFHNIAYDTLCSDAVYYWRGKRLTATGTYFDSIVDPNGCDSVYELRLTVFPNHITTIQKQLCPGNVMTFNGRTISTPGVYFDTLMRSSAGCDSIIKLVVSYSPNYMYESTAYFCQGDTFDFRGKPIYTSGTYFDTVPQAAPLCDEVYKLVLREYPTYYFVQYATVCSNDVLMFGGRRITAPGTYYDRHTTIHGCDSTYELHVTTSQPTYSTEHVTICQQQPYFTPTGKRLDRQGTFYDTLINVQGCDSIITFYVNAFNNLYMYDTLAICRGGSGIGIISGVTFNAAGDYTSTVNHSGSLGCDTTVYTHVYYDIINMNVYGNICDGDAYIFRGNSYMQAGTYSLLQQSKTPGACDTMYTIVISVSPVSNSYLTDITCDGKPYRFNSQVLTASGTYTDTLRAANGCDSIITLELTVKDSITYDYNETICENDSFKWFGTWYKFDGVYHHTTIDTNCGCNEYHTLYLSTIKKTRLISINNVEMCQDDVEYSVVPSYTGTMPSRYSLIYDGVTIPSSNNIIDDWYDGSIINVPIPYGIDGNPVRPDNYTVSLQIGNTECGMSTQTISFNLLVKYPSSVLEQHFNDVVSVLNHNYNGGYSFSDYRWYVNGTMLNTSNSSNLYYTKLAANDVVHAELARKGENYFIPTCSITIADLGPNDNGYPVIVQPWPNSAHVTAKESATYRLCTPEGKILQTGELGKDEEIELALPYVAGCYFFITDTETAGRKVFRLVVR